MLSFFLRFVPELLKVFKISRLNLISANIQVSQCFGRIFFYFYFLQSKIIQCETGFVTL